MFIAGAEKEGRAGEDSGRGRDGEVEEEEILLICEGVDVEGPE